MKSVLALFLACLMLAGSLLPQNDLSELGKLPQLLEHYRYHHSVAGGGLSLGEFLIEHYGSGMATHFGCTFSARHQQDHQGLPLHGHHECSRHVAFLLLAPLPAFWPRLAASASPQYRPASRVLYQDGPAPALLQPPRA
jgi:hypothetical protein